MRRMAALLKVAPGVVVFMLAAGASAQEPPALVTERDKVNYGIGVNIISNLKAQGVEIDLERVIRGMRDMHAGGKLALSDEDVRIAIQKYQLAVRQKRSSGAPRAK